MTIRLPATSDILMPLVRILVMAQGGWTTTTQAWEILPIPTRMDRFGKRYSGRPHGYELDSVEEPPALPLIGAAAFHFDYGSINGVEYDIDDGKSLTTARDLLGYDVRIQMAPAPASLTPGMAFSPAWKTVFLGTVISQDDDPWTDDQISETLSGGGRRTYRCADLLWRTQRWPMNRHTAVTQVDGAAGSDVNPRQYTHCYGHPGYNYAIQGYYRRLMGNRWAGTFPLANGGHPSQYIDPFGDQVASGALKPGANLDQYLAHTWTGSGSSYSTTWTDLQAVNHALASSRASGEPNLVVRACDAGGSATSVLSGSTNPWAVNEGEPCWDFINRVLARQRARGLARLWWTSNANGSSLGTEADPAGNLYPCIAIFPQFLADITFTPPTGPDISFYGATTCMTSAAVDLAGDHRVPAGAIEFSQNETAAVDYLESFGEPIEILVTLSPGDGPLADGTDGNLSKRWSAADETAFAALDLSKPWLKCNDRWKYVWQRWNIPSHWDFKVGKAGDPTTRYSVNWYCDDTAAIVKFDISSTSWTYDSTWRGNPSPLTARILSDLPLYEGYDYTSNNHTRFDGSADTLSPPRLPPLINANGIGPDAGNYYDVTQAGVGLQNDDFGVLIMSGNDQQNGTRAFSDPAVAALGNAYGFTNLAVTVGLELSHRVRCATAIGGLGPTSSPRRKSLYFPGVFLWLADSQAIWSTYDTASTNSFTTPKRAAAGGTPTSPGIIRDDRNALLSLHNLAWAWYSITHRTARWEMRDCGLLPSFTSNDSSGTATTVSYPTVGQFVTTLTCSQIYDLNTPITRKVYDATRGVTTWFTDWGDLDLSQP